MPVKWNEFDVEAVFRDRVVGGIPIVTAADAEAREKVYAGWMAGQKVDDAPEPGQQPLATALAEDPDMPVADPDVPERTGTAFRADEELGLYIEARQVKACLRESAQRLGIIKKVRGARQVLQHDLHVRGLDGTQRIPLGRSAPDGIEERPISVVTPQGPRTSLKQFEFCRQPTIRFRVRLLAGGVGDGLIDADVLADMLELAGELGLGADRSQGEGTFDVVSIDPVAN